MVRQTTEFEPDIILNSWPMTSLSIGYLFWFQRSHEFWGSEQLLQSDLRMGHAQQRFRDEMNEKMNNLKEIAAQPKYAERINRFNGAQKF